MKRVVKASRKLIRGSYDFNNPDIQDLYNDIDNLISTLESIYGNWSDDDIEKLEMVIGPKLYDSLLYAKQDLKESF